MPLSIDDILGYVPLTKAIETVKSNVPRVLPPEFYRRTERVPGDKVRQIITQGTRKSARVLPYGAPSRQIKHLPISGRDIRLLHTEERIKFEDELYRQVREFDRYSVQEKFRDEARRQVTGAVNRQVNLETNAVNVMLANGKMWFDADGGLLPTSSGADLELDYGIPAGNLNQISGIISASWATDTTDIPGQINAIKQRAVTLTGYPLKYALYGKNIMSYLMKNSFVKEYLRYHIGAEATGYWLKSGQIPPGLFDLIWVPMQNAFIESEAGTTSEIYGADNITFTPDPADASVYGIFEGSHPVPKQFGIANSVDAAMAMWDYEYGRYGYATMEINPIAIIGVYGDTFLPMLQNPSAYFVADTTP